MRRVMSVHDIGSTCTCSVGVVGVVSGYGVHKWDMLVGADIICDVAKINRVDFFRY